jgi:hypothetical protein
MAVYPPHAQYPTGHDVLNLLISAGMNNLADPTAYDRLSDACSSYAQAASDEFEVDTGRIPFLVPGSLISNATNATPIQVTTGTVPHNLATGQTATIFGVLGNGAANVTGNSVTVVDPLNFTIDNSAGSGAYTGGGVAAGDATRYYDPQGPEHGTPGYTLLTTRGRGGSNLLELDNGLLAVTSLTSGLFADASGDDAGGTVRVEHVDFDLYPVNSLQMKRPYEWIEFAWSVYGTRRSIKIVGAFGYCRVLPENVWRAILGGAACKLKAEASLLVTQGLAKMKIADDEYTFPATVLDSHFAPWEKQFCKAKRAYSLAIVGF